MAQLKVRLRRRRNRALPIPIQISFYGQHTAKDNSNNNGRLELGRFVTASVKGGADVKPADKEYFAKVVAAQPALVRKRQASG